MGCGFSRSRDVKEGDAPIFLEYEGRPGSRGFGFVAGKIAGGDYSAEMGVAAEAKGPEASLFFRKTNIINVLDTFGSSLSSLTPSGGFTSGITMRKNKVSILAFEVANTITKGAKLMQSLSEENIMFMKNEVLASEGVQHLIFADHNELMKIAASDKRDELLVFSVEVARFGNLCKDPEWHNLSRFFQRLDSDLTPRERLKEEAEAAMRELIGLAQLTSDLYHEYHAWESCEKDYKQKLHGGESFTTASKGEEVGFLKQQRKLVKSLKKRSLWSKSLDEIVERLVEVVMYLHREISAVFGFTSLNNLSFEPGHDSEMLGVSGLALHYANIINQIENIVSRPIPLHSNTRNNLYNGLPTVVKTALRSRIQSSPARKLTVAEIKIEMQRTLQWIYPMAENTIKAHQGFGWVGEWANLGTEINKKPLQNLSVARLQTLYYADKEKTEEYILQLVVLLHYLVEQVQNTGFGFRSSERVNYEEEGKSTSTGASQGTFSNKATAIKLSPEDIQMLESITNKTLVLGRSKSHGYLNRTEKRSKRRCYPSRSSGSSPIRDAASLDSRFERRQILDVIDGLNVIDPFPVPFYK